MKMNLISGIVCVVPLSLLFGSPSEPPPGAKIIPMTPIDYKPTMSDNGRRSGRECIRTARILKSNGMPIVHASPTNEIHRVAGDIRTSDVDVAVSFADEGEPLPVNSQTNAPCTMAEESDMTPTNKGVVKPMTNPPRQMNGCWATPRKTKDVEVSVSFEAETNAAPFSLKDATDTTPFKLLDDDDAYTCAGLIPAPPPPTPEEIEAAFQAMLATAQAIPWDDANVTNRIERMLAVKGLGYYVNTNSLAYLSTVWRNPEDPAQYTALQSAIGVSLEAGGDEWKDIIVEVATNQYGDAPIRKIFADRFEDRYYRESSASAAYRILFDNYRYRYATNQVQRAKIAAFINGRLLVATDFEGLTVDMRKFVMDVEAERTKNTAYRHSQQRRDNLTRARNASHLGNVMNTPEKRIKSRYDDRLEDAQPVE